MFYLGRKGAAVKPGFGTLNVLDLKMFILLILDCIQMFNSPVYEVLTQLGVKIQ